jgi:hypothetical protein
VRLDPGLSRFKIRAALVEKAEVACKLTITLRVGRDRRAAHVEKAEVARTLIITHLAENVEVTVRVKLSWCRCLMLLGVGAAHLPHQTQQCIVQHVSVTCYSDAREVKTTAKTMSVATAAKR